MALAIVLDTNVLSELMRPQPAARVMAWFEEKAESDFFITAITRAEIMLGIALLPSGRRKEGLASAASEMFLQDFAGHCLSFDERAADCYAMLVAERGRAGQPISTEDAQIAAIAITSGLPLATRNGKDFGNIAGLTVINPWSAA